MNHVPSELTRNTDTPPPVPIRQRMQTNHLASRVHVALNNMPAKPLPRRDGPLQVHNRPFTQIPQIGPLQSLRRNIRAKRFRLQPHRRQTHAVNGNARTFYRILQYALTSDAQPRSSSDNAPDLLNDPCEHIPPARIPRRQDRADARVRSEPEHPTN